MIMQISSGMGPVECRVAVGGIFNRLQQEYPDIEVITSVKGEAEEDSHQWHDGVHALGHLRSLVVPCILSAVIIRLAHLVPVVPLQGTCKNRNQDTDAGEGRDIRDLEQSENAVDTACS